MPKNRRGAREGDGGRDRKRKKLFVCNGREEREGGGGADRCFD